MNKKENPRRPMQNPEVSIVLPCRNEEEALGDCITAIQEVLESDNIHGEIIVSDSSSDRSPVIAEQHGVRVVKHDREGYGIAVLEGFAAARARYIFFADPDGTYDFGEVPRFLSYLDSGCDFVIGNRFQGKIAYGAMPWLHRYIGNPLLSLLLRFFFRTKIHDAHCGMRALTKAACDALDLCTTGMEFASEMIVRAVQEGLRIKEIPIDYYQRKGNSKLRSFVDGWRHLRFMLLLSPLFLYLIPGLTLFFIGVFSMLWLYIGTPVVLGIRFFYHPMFVSSLLVITGYQVVMFSLFAKIYALTHLREKNPRLMRFLDRYVTLEKIALLGIIISLCGVVIYATIFFRWVRADFGALEEVKNSIVALTLIAIGIQTLFSSFMLGILGIRGK